LDTYAPIIVSVATGTIVVYRTKCTEGGNRRINNEKNSINHRDAGIEIGPLLPDGLSHLP
jgi:hypothetical protein